MKLLKHLQKQCNYFLFYHKVDKDS